MDIIGFLYQFIILNLGILFLAKSKVLTHAAEIINKHFSEAIHEKEAEIDAIEDSILEAQKALHLLRYGSVSQTYSNFREMVSKSLCSILMNVKLYIRISVYDDLLILTCPFSIPVWVNFFMTVFDF